MRQVPRQSVGFEIWALHLALALALGPLVALSEATVLPAAFWYGIASVYGAAPLLGYGWSMRGRLGPPPSNDPCVRTGSVLGWHWFEFAKGGEDRWWTRDGALAERIRARRHPLPMQGHGLHVRVGPGPRFLLRRDRMMKNLAAVSVTMVVGFFTLFAWLGFFSASSADRQGLIELTSVSLACAPFTLMPALGVLWAAYGGGAAVAGFLWHRWVAPAQAHSIRWTGSQLHTEHGSSYLDEPGTTVRLSFDAFGTALQVQGPSPLVVRGEHQLLAPLADALRQRQADQPATDSVAFEAMGRMKAIRDRLPQPGS